MTFENFWNFLLRQNQIENFHYKLSCRSNKLLEKQTYHTFQLLIIRKDNLVQISAIFKISYLFSSIGAHPPEPQLAAIDPVSLFE